MKTFLALAASLFLIASTGVAQDAILMKQLDDDLKAQKSKFMQSGEQTKKVALAGFDKMIAFVKAGKATAAAKVEMIDKIKSARDQFEKDGTWPKDDEYLQAQFDYATAIQRSYQPVSKAYDRLIETCLKANNTVQATAYKNDKADLDSQMPGRSIIVKGARLNGNRTVYPSQRGSGVHCRFHITDVTDNTFQAKLDALSDMEMSGTIDGIKLVLKVTKVTHGSVQPGDWYGYVLGEKILLSHPVVSKGGKTTVYYFVFTK